MNSSRRDENAEHKICSSGNEESGEKENEKSGF
jgi:hypothetical protein